MFVVSNDKLLEKESDVTVIDESTQKYPLKWLKYISIFTGKLGHYV